MLRESQKQVREPTEKKQGDNLPALPCKTSGAVGAKRKTTPLRRSNTDKRTRLVSTQNTHLKTGARQRMDVERIRQFMFAAALRTKHKNFPTLLDDVSSN